ncbi:hypothetical protein [Pacificoceanicola onchidii]|uniref:hypothetical protein n=1 Tax=Pacificoceanicola onchidii TaxID=2562685 RepID=UPI0010A61429|nr:hypothetical protein [Pacificoceanicola onchidii]
MKTKTDKELSEANQVSTASLGCLYFAGLLALTILFVFRDQIAIANGESATAPSADFTRLLMFH